MSKQKELIKNTAIIAIGKISTQIVSFLLIPFYTLFLSPYEYGYLDLVLTYIVLLTPLTTLQLDRAAFRFLIDSRGDKNKEKKIISSTLFIITNIVIAIIVLSLILSIFIKIKHIELIVSSIVATIFSNLSLQFSRGMGNNKKFAIANVISSLITLSLNIILVFILHQGVTGVLISIILSNISILTYITVSMRLHKYLRFNKIKKGTCKNLVSYSLPLVPSGVSWWAINVSDRTIISIIIGITANGIYAIANKYATVFNAIYSIFDMSWTESASIHINSKDKNEFFSEIFNSSFKVFGSIGLLLITALPLIFNIIINNKFSESYQYIPILIIAAFVNAIVSQYSAVYIAKKLTKKVLSTSISAAIINITLNLIFIQYIGLYATSISTVIAFLSMAIFRHHDIKKYVQIKYEQYLLIKMVLIYSCSISIYYVNNPTLNVLNFIITIIFTVIINNKIITSVKNEVFTKLGALK